MLDSIPQQQWSSTSILALFLLACVAIEVVSGQDKPSGAWGRCSKQCLQTRTRTCRGTELCTDTRPCYTHDCHKTLDVLAVALKDSSSWLAKKVYSKALCPTAAKGSSTGEKSSVTILEPYSKTIDSGLDWNYSSDNVAILTTFRLPNFKHRQEFFKFR